MADHYGSVRHSVQCLHFDYQALKDATQQFDRRKVNNGGCLLGEGGFGPVYRGMLKMTEVAIKELRKVNMVRDPSVLYHTSWYCCRATEELRH